MTVVAVDPDGLDPIGPASILTGLMPIVGGGADSESTHSSRRKISMWSIFMLHLAIHSLAKNGRPQSEA
jgi:hypothetical protein